MSGKRSLIWDLSATFSKQFGTLATSIVLARLLGPEEFGIIGMALVFIGISNVLIDAGFTDALIQRKELSGSLLSSVFYLNILISLLLSFILFISAGPIADFYATPDVELVLQYLSVIPVINSFGIIHLALLMKKMKFRSLAIRTVLSTLISGIVGISLALSDFGLMSLVWQQISMSLINSLLLWWSSKWRPRGKFALNEISTIWKFSSYVFVDSVLRQVFNRINTLAVGKIFDPYILGLYTRSESLCSQVKDSTTNSLKKVIYPMFSLAQEDDKRFKQLYLRSFAVSTGITTLLVGALYLLGDLIILSVLGEKWREAIPIFKILLFISIPSPIINVISKALLSRGYSKEKMKLGLYQRILRLAAIPTGIYFGIHAFAIAEVTAVFIILGVFLFYGKQYLGFSLMTQIWKVILPSAPIALFLALTYFVEIPLENWMLAILFCTFNILFVIAIKHETYYFGREFFRFKK